MKLKNKRTLCIDCWYRFLVQMSFTSWLEHYLINVVSIFEKKNKNFNLFNDCFSKRILKIDTTFEFSNLLLEIISEFEFVAWNMCSPLQMNYYRFELDDSDLKLKNWVTHRIWIRGEGGTSRFFYLYPKIKSNYKK